jgi:hypothetical protein
MTGGNCLAQAGSQVLLSTSVEPHSRNAMLLGDTSTM